MRRAVQALVVVAVVIVAGGLLAAGVNRVREVAKRLTCANNLKCVGMDLRDYHDSYFVFPLATVTEESPGNEEALSRHPLPAAGLPPEKRLSWYVGTWAFTGEGQVVLLLNRQKPWDAEENLEPRIRSGDEEHGVRERVLEGFRTWQCPANPNRTLPGLPFPAHYVGIAGVGDDAAGLPLHHPRAGIFGYERQASLNDVRRGTGHTMLLAETAWQNGPWTAGGRPTTRGLVPGDQPYIGPDGQFGGTHRGGALVCFADGSVRALDDSIDPETLQALATLAGGDEVGLELKPAQR
jgi:hypothetical protein